MRAVANFIKEAEPNNLMAENDYAFMKNVYNVLGKLFDLTPPFKIEEFFSPNAAVERKISFILQLIQTIKNKEQQLNASKRTGTVATKVPGKTKSVTFRKDDSVALPPGQAAQQQNRNASEQDTQRHSALVEQERSPYAAGRRLNNHQHR